MCVQGGGPYGQQVTRGQDLTGKDFSGQTLIKQDFKTVHTLLHRTLSYDRFSHLDSLTMIVHLISTLKFLQ